MHTHHKIMSEACRDRKKGSLRKGLSLKESLQPLKYLNSLESRKRSASPLISTLWGLSRKPKFSRISIKLGQDYYQTYARTRVERVFSAFFCPEHRKWAENGQKWHFSFLRESQVARNSGDIPVCKMHFFEKTPFQKTPFSDPELGQ